VARGGAQAQAEWSAATGGGPHGGARQRLGGGARARSPRRQGGRLGEP